MKTIYLTDNRDGLVFNITTYGDVLFNSELTPHDDIALKVHADDFYPGTLDDWKKSVKSRALTA